MPADLPLVVVIGDRPVLFLQRALNHIATVSVQDSIGEHRPDVVLYAAGGTSDEEMFLSVQRQAQSQAIPLLVYLEGIVTEAHSRPWIQRGALEVLARHQVVDAILRRLPGGYRPATTSFVNDLLAMVSQPQAQAQPTVESTARLEESLPEVEPEPIMADVQLAPDLVDPLSSFLDRAPPSDAPDIPDLAVPPIPREGPALGYLRAVSEYNVIRRALLSRLGTSGGRVLNSLIFHRTRAIENLAGPILPDTFGMWKRDSRTPLGWSAQIAGLEGPSPCEILNASADGLCLRTRMPPPEDKRLTVQMEVAGALRSELLLETRWQRRTARDSWEVGAVILDARIQEL